MKTFKIVLSIILLIALIPFAIISMPAFVLMLTINSINGAEIRERQERKMNDIKNAQT